MKNAFVVSEFFEAKRQIGDDEKMVAKKSLKDHEDSRETELKPGNSHTSPAVAIVSVDVEKPVSVTVEEPVGVTIEEPIVVAVEDIILVEE
ncbi:zinc finger BED domain-containing protein DAYSLEEPER-like [Dorcoceras hygrometricum]|uniref:Zinc finger BED domain-containing protein DAYSLEEPER-like n=1 Tax=Dorcoceras hygrometricum TaxID=472368 RepID=A0A2Z7CTD5_9LAMI|nr:zinc finger BED domain-containing protein DAYSLEEPER-like [Dorcoceras hygrometricum]